MKIKNVIWAALIVVSALNSSCRQKTNAEEEKMVNAESIPTDVYVDTIKLHRQTFHRQLICNGKLRAIEKCELAFTDGGIVKGVYVHNGCRVAKGQLIAKTDGGDATLEVEKATKQLEKAKVDLADRLIGLGYDGISANVPADVMHRAKVASGYYLAQYQLQWLATVWTNVRLWLLLPEESPIWKISATNVWISSAQSSTIRNSMWSLVCWRLKSRISTRGRR